MSVSNILLAYPNFKWDKWVGYTSWNMHPYNLGLLASMIRDEYKVNIIDCNIDNLSKEDFAKKIQDLKPDILGISVITNEYAKSGLIAAGIAKEVNPSIITVAGGVSVISNPSSYIKDINIDYAVVGEGEYVFKELCNFLNEKGNLPTKGIMYKKNGEIVDLGMASLIIDLDSIPLPSYDLFDFKKYTTQLQRESIDRPRVMPYARIRTSRGCPFNCCFCEVGSISGKNPRYRSLANVTKEIEWLIKDYGIKSLVFDDDNLVFNKERAKNLFKIMIDRGYNLKWSIPGVAVYMLDEEMISLMKESGCAFINIAIESGNPDVLKNIIKKPLDLEMAKKNIGIIKKYGIDLAANFIIGFPGETWDQIRQTIKFAEDIDIDYVKIYVATPFPNTELYNMAKEKGYLREEYEENTHLWDEGWIKSKEFRFQDLKILRTYEWDRINFSNPGKRRKIANMMGITEEKLNEIRRETLARVNP